MKLKIFLRPSLTIIFAFIGAFIARGGTPPEIFAITGKYFIFVAFLAFGILGFILLDLVELAGKAGIAALAKQIASYIPASGGRFSFKKKRNKKVVKFQNPLVIDTSAIIDGRLADVAKTGFIFGTFLVIPSVIGELHKLADSADSAKRQKGRFGLDSLGVLKHIKHIKLEVLKNEPEDKEVDHKLITLCKNVSGRIVTVDFNLNKVAIAKNVGVLNINELANAVKTAVLPKDRLKVQINALGTSKNQGVGYLGDGTMVVVEGGAHLKGKNAQVEVLRVLQTAAGKMIFAKIAN
ncbi:hypothetical protein A3I53_04115 [Candidatus Curtissbacteria bacterium RIFCSPLOWO2_02_FULL_40_13b]|uniref:TRAM domain-containing protein n=3 Tax=Candidatus Curtissiibacteriota TaxID=1752717 RepID=A0A1F5HQL3_9BACT|nr:MAG: hypothetical protein A2693_03800 [Candidatus Curtissbacteria bacterium RIFCSPHIGHO2_01_FULL_40_12]OGE05099.1 MAG: hypothetical protein A3F45_03520 [Candidatus Curtissbacteria bacterium RIFCSPHIGHO2_12_FULL_41_17]OGE06353.1 MAG: hypothetical protein A3I53_04115 [Candidatus Curtissbacteria bacterium RIFCSPLOWO2_02_FULL_40_13b]